MPTVADKQFEVEISTKYVMAIRNRRPSYLAMQIEALERDKGKALLHQNKSNLQHNLWIRVIWAFVCS